MRLTSYTDFALRVLLYAGSANESVTISRIAEAYGISKDHLRKVVHTLSQHGYLNTSQGRYGGITLAMPADQINIRDVVLHFESTELLECFNPETNTCPIIEFCRLKKAIASAQAEFMNVLGNYYLSDFVTNPGLVKFASARPVRLIEAE